MITVRVNDGFASNNSSLATFKVSVLPVDQVPFFALNITYINVRLYSQPVTVAGAVTRVSAGPTNETNQAVSYVVKADNTKLFLAQPAISTNGVLTFTPQASGGSATVSVRIHDNGGVKNGGHDTSDAQTFSITIPDNPFTAMRGVYSGLFYQTNEPDNQSCGFLQLKLATNGQFSGFLLCAGTSNVFGGQFPIPVPTNTFPVSNTAYVLNLGLDTQGDDSLAGTVASSSAGWESTLLALLNPFSSQAHSPLAGTYLAAIPGNASSSLGPSGDSVLSLIVSNNGLVSITGYLADDTSIKQHSAISSDGHIPLYVPLGSGGSLSGWLGLNSGGADRFTDDSQVVWLESAHSIYPAGFTNDTVALASGYSTNGGVIFPGQSGTVILSGGQLTTPITNLVTFSNNVILVDSSATNRLGLAIYRPTGQIFGGFFDAAGQSNEINSVILQSSNAARGYFIGNGHCGSFLLIGR